LAVKKGFPMENLRVGLVQMRCEKGAVVENLVATAAYIREAAACRVDVLGFPEASLSGYVEPARYPHAVLRLDGPEVAQAVALTRGYDLTVLMGCVEANEACTPAGAPAGKPYITQIVARDGLLLGFYRKRQNVDEDAEWFACGEDVPVFAHEARTSAAECTFGIAICADIGDEEIFWRCAQQGAQIAFELAAPGLYGDQETRDWESGYRWWEGECCKLLGAYAPRYGLWIAVATQAGRTTDEDFPGGGYVFAPDGRRLFATTDGEEGAVYLELGEAEGEYLCREI
jgi:predicted amidohydrolase